MNKKRFQEKLRRKVAKRKKLKEHKNRLINKLGKDGEEVYRFFRDESIASRVRRQLAHIKRKSEK